MAINTQLKYEDFDKKIFKSLLENFVLHDLKYLFLLFDLKRLVLKCHNKYFFLRVGLTWTDIELWLLLNWDISREIEQKRTNKFYKASAPSKK